MTHRLVLSLLLFNLAGSGVVAFGDDTDRVKYFDQKVKPILIGRCLKCHATSREGGLDLTTRKTALAGSESGVVLVPGNPDESRLFELVSSDEMPPDEALNELQVAILRQWIVAGAYFPDAPLDPLEMTTDKRAGYDWWSLQPIGVVEPPEIPTAPAVWQANPIDRFVLAKLSEKNLEPSAPAVPRVLIRRATYDLSGLPPSPEEVRQFLTACERETGSAVQVGEKAYGLLIDRLLALPHYGEQWGRHWLDVVRFGESTGFEQNHLITDAWPFRDYIIRSLNNDKPFDQLVKEHLAGDRIDGENPDVKVGTAFLVCGPFDAVGNQDPVKRRQIRANTVDEIIRATGETFLGLTVGCGRCHDHKFDPISQRDYYQLYATFDGVTHGSQCVSPKHEQDRYNRQLEALAKIAGDSTKKKKELTDVVLARAEEKAAKYERSWTRESVSQQLTEEKFRPVEVQYVRLMVEHVDSNVHASIAYRLDEFEIWSAKDQPRNVALATAGGEASGSSRIAADFMGAYDANLTIDGDYNAWWLATSPSLTIKLARPEVIDRVTFSSDRPNAVGSQGRAGFPCEYRIEVSSDGENWQEVASSHNREPANKEHRDIRLYLAERTVAESALIAAQDAVIGDVNKRIAELPKLTTWQIGKFHQPQDKTYIFLGGDTQRPGDEVVPASPTMLANVRTYELKSDAAEGDRRMALAEWLVAPNNPLTPRVLANRIWHYHFGTGIVATPSDFGFMGDRPSHPRLLDWLSDKLQHDGWRIKPLHRQIMLSQTYRQASGHRAEAARIDADSRLLWRFPPRRLTGEEIRDTMLAVAGRLDTRMGGQGYTLYRYLEDNVATYVPLDKHPPESYRRAVYHHRARATQIDLITDFDGPDCAFAAPRRSATISPLQVLTLLNHSFTLDMAGCLSERLEWDAGEAPVAQVRRAFQLAFVREPATEEIVAAAALVESHGLRAFCRALLNSSELIYID